MWFAQWVQANEFETVCCHVRQAEAHVEIVPHPFPTTRRFFSLSAGGRSRKSAPGAIEAALRSAGQVFHSMIVAQQIVNTMLSAIVVNLFPIGQLPFVSFDEIKTLSRPFGPTISDPDTSFASIATTADVGTYLHFLSQLPRTCSCRLVGSRLLVARPGISSRFKLLRRSNRGG